jgi:hypothetical protein
MGKILSVLLIIAGVGVFLFGTHLSNEASLGAGKVEQAEQQEQQHQRPILGPVRRGMRNSENEHAQQKIGQAESQVATSALNANWLQGSGAALFAIGLATLLFTCCRKKK